MTVTPDQAKMLTTLALAIRPTGAPRIDGPGVHAAIGRVKHMDLHEVIQVTLAVLRDPTVSTPANIADTKSRHWQGLHVVGVNGTRQPFDRASTCVVCAEPQDRCRRLWADDHEFRSVARAAAEPPGIDVHRTVEALKAEVQTTADRPEQRPVVHTEHGDAARAALEGATA